MEILMEFWELIAPKRNFGSPKIPVTKNSFREIHMKIRNPEEVPFKQKDSFQL